MNSVNLMGRLCGDIELKTTQNGSICTNFSLAVDRYANGNKTTDFIRCVAWGKTAENIGKFFHKGDMLAVSGSIKTGSYTDRNGAKHYTTNVYVTNFFFTGNRERNTQNGSYSGYRRNGYSTSYSNGYTSGYQNGYERNSYDDYYDYKSK